MLKKALFTPAHPSRYSTHPPRASQDRLLTRRTRPISKFVLRPTPSSTYRERRVCFGRLGAARREWRYAFGALFTCGFGWAV
jgi:hypothetical protein